MKCTETNVRRLLKRWRPRLGIDSRWDVEVRLYVGRKAWPKEHKGNAAFIVVSTGYFQAEMHLNVEAIESGGSSLEMVVLHELVHVVLDPLAIASRDGLGERNEATARNLLEQAVETVTRALLAR